MPALDSYLFFDGTCAEAMRFYEKTLGGKIEAMMTYADSPEAQPHGAGGKDRIMHAHLSLDGRVLMASDTPPGQGGKAMGGFALSLSYPTADEARRIFEALSPGASILMPMQKTFWSQAFGMLTDRYGTPWMVGGGDVKS